MAVFEHPALVPVTIKLVFAVGETVNVFTVAPELHAYVVAPLAINVAVWPEHMVGELTDIIGNGLTTTVVTVAPEHAPLVPETENEVVDAGETIILFPIEPLLHEYEVAPVEISVVVCPAHIVGLLTDNDKFGLIMILAVAEFTQPCCSPNTV